MSDANEPLRAKFGGGVSTEKALRESEERFRILVEGVFDYAIFLLDPDGYVVSWNEGARRINGYSADEIIGEHFSRFYPPEALAKNWPARELEIARAEGRFEEEGWRVRKDDTLFWASVVITALWDESGDLRGFAKVTRDLTERKRIEELEADNRQLYEFLAMLAHELRNPLAPVRNAVNIMRLKATGDPGLEWARDVVDRQVTHLARLVDDLVDVSRITSGRISLEREKVEMAAVVTRALESARPFVESRRHALEIALPATPLVVEGDPERLAQVLANLLDNAAKYTPEEGKISLAVEREGDEAVLRVRDTGKGMPEELRSRVFDLFTQGARGLDRSEGGLGIGLTLVERIVSLHGGSVEAHSEGAGKGSEFVVRLPALAAEKAAEESEADRAEKAGSPLRVLVVDDNVDAGESLALLLQLHGYDVGRAADGPEALEVARELRPDVALLDIGLPGMDGYEVGRRLREMDEGVTLVATTGYGNEEDRRRSREAGFDHHLDKPIDHERLDAILAAIAAR
jgi:PAS domain S-box-containing protein